MKTRGEEKKATLCGGAHFSWKQPKFLCCASITLGNDGQPRPQQAGVLFVELRLVRKGDFPLVISGKMAAIFGTPLTAFLTPPAQRRVT
jgi:hypothetical protein